MGDPIEAPDLGKLQRPRLRPVGKERNAAAKNDQDNEPVEPIESVAIDEGLLHLPGRRISSAARLPLIAGRR